MGDSLMMKLFRTVHDRWSGDEGGASGLLNLHFLFLMPIMTTAQIPYSMNKSDEP